MKPANPSKKPASPDDWMVLGLEISSLFDGAPIDEQELFAGRATEVHRILETVFARSKHVVLYGERGVGKTSLSNIFWKRFNKMARSFVVARVQAGPHDTFTSLWVRAIEEMRASGLALGISDFENLDADFNTVTPTLVRREFQKCASSSIPIVIVDEYNEVIDKDAKQLTANLVKEFYDFSVTTTIILVGVSDNISDLIGDHASAARAIVEIPLHRMSNQELKEIIQKRANRTVMSFSGDAIWTIISLSRGLPYFTQTLSKHAALQTISDRRLMVTNSDVETSMAKFIEQSETLFKDAYRDATRSNQENYFQQSLLVVRI